MLEKVIQVFEAAKNMRKRAYIKVTVPGQNYPEIIINYPDSLDYKAEYYSRAYDENGLLRANPEIRIIEVGMVEVIEYSRNVISTKSWDSNHGVKYDLISYDHHKEWR